MSEMETKTQSDINLPGTRCIRLDHMRLKEPLCLSALEGSHFRMKNGPWDFDKWAFVTSIGLHSILGGGLSIRSGRCGGVNVDQGPLTFLPFFSLCCATFRHND